MKAIVIDESRNLVWQDVPDPVCHDEFDVKIAVKACALNRADVMQRAGQKTSPKDIVDSFHRPGQFENRAMNKSSPLSIGVAL